MAYVAVPLAIVLTAFIAYGAFQWGKQSGLAEARLKNG